MRIHVSALLIAVSFFTACKSKNSSNTATPPNKNAPSIVDVVVAAPMVTNTKVEVNGTVVASDMVELHPEIAGKITFLHWPEGTVVTKGTVLARLNDADLQAQLQKIKVQTTLAEQTEARMRKLLSINGVNVADYDVALNQLNTLKADAGIVQAQIDKTVIRAPFTGVLGLRSISLGAYVSATNALGTIQQIHPLKVDFAVPDVYASYIQKGKLVQLQTLQQLPAITAEIVATQPQADPGTRNIMVRALVKGGTLQPGAFVKVLLPQSSQNAILVPSSCIIPDARSKQMIVVKNGKAQFVKVTTGTRNAGLVQITSGIHMGDSVVVTGVLFVRPNQPVKVRSIKKVEQFNNE